MYRNMSWCKEDKYVTTYFSFGELSQLPWLLLCVCGFWYGWLLLWLHDLQVALIPLEPLVSINCCDVNCGLFFPEPGDILPAKASNELSMILLMMLSVKTELIFSPLNFFFLLFFYTFFWSLIVYVFSLFFTCSFCCCFLSL